MLGTIGVIAGAIFYGAIGVAAMIRPVNLLQAFSITAEAPESRNEIRGVYGGLPLAISGLLIYSLIRPDLSNGILFALAVCSLGFAVGRVVSALIDRSFHRSPQLWTVLEIIVAVLIASNIKGL